MVLWSSGFSAVPSSVATNNKKVPVWTWFCLILPWNSGTFHPKKSILGGVTDFSGSFG